MGISDQRYLAGCISVGFAENPSGRRIRETAGIKEYTGNRNNSSEPDREEDRCTTAR